MSVVHGHREITRIQCGNNEAHGLDAGHAGFRTFVTVIATVTLFPCPTGVAVVTIVPRNVNKSGSLVPYENSGVPHRGHGPPGGCNRTAGRAILRVEAVQHDIALLCIGHRGAVAPSEQSDDDKDEEAWHGSRSRWSGGLVR